MPSNLIDDIADKLHRNTCAISRTVGDNVYICGDYYSPYTCASKINYHEKAKILFQKAQANHVSIDTLMLMIDVLNFREVS